MSQAWLIASGKGGSGKSLVTAALGCALVDSGYSVCLIDGSFGLRGLDFPLGLQNETVFDIEDVLAGHCTLQDALVSPKGIPDLSLLTAPQKSDIHHVTPENLNRLIKELKRSAAYILIDLPTALNDTSRQWFSAADGSILVTTSEEASIRCCDQYSRFLRKNGINNQLLLINQVFEKWVNKGLCPAPQMIADTLDLPLLGYLPADQKLIRFLMNNSYLNVSSGPFFEAIYRVCSRMLGETTAMPMLKAKFKPSDDK